MRVFRQSIRRLLILLALFGGAGTLWPQQSAADSLLRLLSRPAPDTQRVRLLTDYAWAIVETQTGESETRFREALRLAQRQQYLIGEGAAWNGLGAVETIRGNNAKAIEYYEKALEVRRNTGVQQDIAGTINNLALAYETAGKYDASLKLHRENLRIAETLRDTFRMARAYRNIAGLLESEGAYAEAQSQLNEARLIFENFNDSVGMAQSYTMMGHIYFELDRYDLAHEWYGRALDIQRSLQDPDGIADALTDYGNVLDELDSSKMAIQYYLQALEIRRQLEDEPGAGTVYYNIAEAYKHLEDYTQALYYLQKAFEIRAALEDTPGLMECYNVQGDVLRRQGRLREAMACTEKYFAIAEALGEEKYIERAYKDFAELYAALKDYKKAFEFQRLHDTYRHGRVDATMARSFARREALFADQKKQQEIEQQKQKIQLRDAEINRRNAELKAFFGGVVALLLLVALLYNRNRIRAKANRDLAAQNAVIERERRRADELLTNILPTAAAAELKAHNRVKPVRYESVSVLFSDFKNFTVIAEQMNPEDLVQALDDYFRLFDQISARHGMEKIKTIGDAYMCAGGLPTPNDTHPLDAVRAALDMQQALQELMQVRRVQGLPVFEMRIGIHTGPVVAGVVGSHKFAYDIWGDAVNTAARMEQGGEPGKINISETTYELVKNQVVCTYRGRLSAKNKGEIAMYFVERLGEDPIHQAGRPKS
jgi:adenylate cyclase